MEHILKLRKYAIQDKETGTVYEDADTIEKAEEIVKLFEQIDRDGGKVAAGTYMIVTRDQLREDLPSNYTVIDIPATVEAETDEDEEYIPLF